MPGVLSGFAGLPCDAANAPDLAVETLNLLHHVAVLVNMCYTMQLKRLS